MPQQPSYSTKTLRKIGILLESASSSALEDSWNNEGGKSESLEWVEDSGEASGGAINQNSAGVSDINNHDNFAEVFSEVDICNSAGLDKLLEHLKDI